jgi:hypothetical protein
VAGCTHQRLLVVEAYRFDDDEVVPTAGSVCVARSAGEPRAEVRRGRAMLGCMEHVGEGWVEGEGEGADNGAVEGARCGVRGAGCGMRVGAGEEGVEGRWRAVGGPLASLDALDKHIRAALLVHRLFASELLAVALTHKGGVPARSVGGVRMGVRGEGEGGRGDGERKVRTWG